MMNRRLGLLLGLCGVATVASAEVKPNIIYLMTDDQNYGSVGCYGNTEVQTPNMDKLGYDGVIFDRHYNTTSICMASRANVMTGMYEYKTGTNFSHGDMAPDIWKKSYPILLREAGYMTAFAGKVGFVIEGKKTDRGLPSADFDVWAGAPGQSQYETIKNKAMAKYAEEFPHSTLAYGAFGRDVIKKAVSEKKPFCLSISFKAVHKPAVPDPRFDHIYAGKTFTKPANFGRAAGEHMSPQSKVSRQYARFSEWHYDTDYDGVMATYYQQVYGVDVALGMIRAELEAQGVADNTVIILTSDNGYICGSHGYGSKVLPMEESSRAPMMIFDPRSAAAGKKLRSPALTGNIDFAPTILEIAGLPIPENMDGKSLLPLLKNPATNVHEQLAFMNLYGPEPLRSLSCITKEWKYTYWWYGDNKMEPMEELYNMKKDSLELTNRANDPEAAPVLAMMRAKYDAELAKWKAQAVQNNDYQRYATLFDRTIPMSEKNLKKQAKAGKNKGAKTSKKKGKKTHE